MSNEKQKVLIVDDSAMNRALLESMLGDQYEILEVENGAEAVALLQEEDAADLAVMLLDIQMPVLDGFGVLRFMNNSRLIEDIPVIMISSEISPAFIEQAYDLGATDYISRPFDEAVVRRRIANTVLLNARQRRLTGIVVEQLREKRKSDQLMISILAHIVEFRNGESGMHVLHIHVFTRLILQHLLTKTDRYPLTQDDINLICTASALHDIGKLSVPDEVLNKPGRFTDEEFAIMKQHTTAGAEMIRALPYDPEEPLLKMSYSICRWHHERYDGRGYPDGLAGEDIPIAAQVVAMADVYDALTSERCYKKAFSHEQAMEMILGGQCGAFNPLLLECLQDIGDELHQLMTSAQSGDDDDASEYSQIAEQLHNYGLSSTERRLQEQDLNSKRFRFVMDNTNDIFFSYSHKTALLKMNRTGASRLGLSSTVEHPLRSQEVQSCFGPAALDIVRTQLRSATPAAPELIFDLPIEGSLARGLFHCHMVTFWSNVDQSYSGLIARLTEDRTDSPLPDALATPEVWRTLELFLKEELQTGSGYSMNHTEAWILSQYLQKMFDIVRLVDPEKHVELILSEDGSIQEAPFLCYRAWNRESPCENCISKSCVSTRGRMTKFEFVGNNVYHIHAVYLEIDGRPCALELVDKITEKALLQGMGQEHLTRTIADYRKEIYTDPVTGIHNRRYYEDRLGELHDVNAVAMIDIDSFKSINDTNGHLVGDMALAKIAGILRGCARRSDVVVRFGGDEFVALFRGIPLEKFEEKLAEMSTAVQEARLPDYLHLQFSISVGGIYGTGVISEMVALADDLMYQAKREKCGIKVRILTGKDGKS